MTTVIDTLERARDYLTDERHWAKGAFKKKLPDGEYAYCALDAVRVNADGKAYISTKARNILHRALIKLALEKQQTYLFSVYASAAWAQREDIMKFNDMYSRHGDVLNLFDEAIKIAESESTHEDD